MGAKKTYYKYLDYIRVIFCIAVLLYHLNILKGGYLAVCSFFALSGYLSCISAFRKEKFSLKDYYINKLLKIYLPLIVVAFISVAVISFFKDINWINLKPEVTSVIFGYNNFWQLNANLDYFARHVSSPFMHLWYVAILLQFELIFPLIYIPLKRLGDKVHKIIPCIILVALSIISFVYFIKVSKEDNIMLVYYNTFTRIFSIFFGLAIGFITSYYGGSIPKAMKKKTISQVMIAVYCLILIVLFCTVDSKSASFGIAMLVTTLITCRLISYCTIKRKERTVSENKLIKSLASVSYEIYLIQYPLIFLLQNININEVIGNILLIVMLIVLSYTLHFALNKDKSKNVPKKMLKIVMISLITLTAVFGGYKYIIAEDHTEEMKQLEEQLNQNGVMALKRQEEYEANYKEEQEQLKKMLEELEDSENKLEELITNMKVVGVGDSVMLGAVSSLYEKFPNGYFDGKVSRSAWVVPDILLELKNSNRLGNPVILNIGANGDCPLEQKKKIIDICEDRIVFWLTVTNDKTVNINDKIKNLANEYENLHIIDWEAISSSHPEYFYADGIHLTAEGRKAYTDAVYNAIYEVYLQEYTKKKEDIIRAHEEEKKNKITFYGDDILLNAYDEIQQTFSTAKFVTNNEITFAKLKEQIEKAKAEDSLTYKLVFAFDRTLKLSKKEYEELINICKESDIFILSTNKDSMNVLKDINYDNVKIIDFYSVIESNSSYVMIDKLHLTIEGNKALSNILKENIK